MGRPLLVKLSSELDKEKNGGGGMGFDAIPEDREQSFPCEVCNGSIKLSAISGLWECVECGCLPGSKLVSGHTKEEPEYHNKGKVK